MSRKNVISLNILAGASDDMSGDITSKEIEVRNLDKAAIHCKWAAGPEGEFQVEARTNEKADWFVLEAGAAWAISSSDSEAQILLNELPFTQIRLKYLASTGTGTLSAYLTSKSVGA